MKPKDHYGGLSFGSSRFNEIAVKFIPLSLFIGSLVNKYGQVSFLDA